jgi:hypothetical protein
MSSDFSLKSVDLSNWTKVITISSNFLNDDPALSSVNLSGFSSVLFIENDFFANDFSLKKIDLSSLNAVQGIGIMLYDCRCLTQVTLPSNNFSNRFRYPAAAQDSFHNAVNKSTCTLHGSWGSDLKNVVGSNISNWTVSS